MKFKPLKNKTGSFKSTPRTGRPKKLSRKDVSSIIEEVNKTIEEYIYVHHLEIQGKHIATC